jgi:tetratricopeptide (TPR) repeat protein
MLPNKFLISLCGGFALFTACRPPEMRIENLRAEWEAADYLGAVVTANVILEQGDSSCEVWCIRARSYRKLLKFAKALSDYESALKRPDSCTIALLEKGQVLAELGDTTAALAVFRTLKATGNAHLQSEAWIESARHAFYHDRFDESLDHLNRAVTHDPSNALAYYYRGYLRSRFFDPDGSAGAAPFRLFSFDTSYADFSQCIAIDPRFADAWYQRGVVQLNRFRDAEGLRDIDRAIQLDPMVAGYYSGRAEYFERKGQWQNALNDIQKAHEISPADTSIIRIEARIRASVQP